jgi:hypothetical protein
VKLGLGEESPRPGCYPRFEGLDYGTSLWYDKVAHMYVKGRLLFRLGWDWPSALLWRNGFFGNWRPLSYAETDSFVLGLVQCSTFVDFL